jgi:hypothetical protein
MAVTLGARRAIAIGPTLHGPGSTGAMPSKPGLAEPAVPRVLRVPDGELGLAARRRLVGQTRQLGANQTPVHRPLFDRRLLIVGLRLGGRSRLRHRR